MTYVLIAVLFVAGVAIIVAGFRTRDSTLAPAIAFAGFVCIIFASVEVVGLMRA